MDKKIEEIKAQIKDFPEYKLFFLAEECNLYLDISTEILKGDLNKDESKVFFDNSLKVRRIRIALSDTLKKRYGFEILDDVGKITEEFGEWYNKWNSWRFSFTDTEWESVNNLIVDGKDIKEYLPNEN